MLNKRLYAAIAILSASIIAFQLALMQNLSVVQWNHFAYMVISVALLGFGASGSMLSLFRSFVIKRYATTLPILFAMCAVAMASVMFLTKSIIPGFNMFMIFSDTREIGLLVLVYLTYFMPFLFGGAAIGLVYTKHSSAIGKLYFADLLGAAAGGALLTALLWIFSPWQLTTLLALLPITGAFLTIDYRGSMRPAVVVAVCALLSGYFAMRHDRPTISEYKSLSKTLTMQGSKIMLERGSPFGELQVVSSPGLRFAPGLSLSWNEQPPAAIALFNNGSWFGAIPLGSAGQRSRFYGYTLYALPFTLGNPQSVLMLDAATAPLAPFCLANGARSVTLVEPNAMAIGVLRGKLATLHDSLLFNPSVTTVVVSSRSFLQSDTASYDLIALPDVGSFGGSSGVLAASEQYLLTIEAFRDMWTHLSSNGYLMVNVWLDYPSRAPLRVLSTITEMLSQQDVRHPERHLVLVRSWGNAVFLVKRSPITPVEVDSLREFCQTRCFDPMVPPRVFGSESAPFNMLQDESFQHFTDTIVYGNAPSLYDRYLFDVKPTTDNQPYFYQFVKPWRYGELERQYGFKSLAYMEVGYFFIFTTFFQILAVALALIILPLLLLKVKGPGVGFTLFYFSGLGVGFMFVEIVLIQQLILFLGQPIYAAATVISLLLLFSGTGSYFSGRFKANRSTVLRVMMVVVPLIVLYAYILSPTLGAMVHVAMVGKIALGALLIGPLAFFMGMAFPLGIRIVSEQNASLVPWAWGINGCASVVSTVTATLAALHFGFGMVMMVAAGAYITALAAILLRRW